MGFYMVVDWQSNRCKSASMWHGPLHTALDPIHLHMLWEEHIREHVVPENLILTNDQSCILSVSFLMWFSVASSLEGIHYVIQITA